MLLLDKLDDVRKTSECARLFGIDFYSVVTRGSQYRVEAAIRHCKACHEKYVLVSPSKFDVSNQSAMRALPLVMEPKSGSINRCSVLEKSIHYWMIVMALSELQHKGALLQYLLSQQLFAEEGLSIMNDSPLYDAKIRGVNKSIINNE